MRQSLMKFWIGCLLLLAFPAPARALTSDLFLRLGAETSATWFGEALAGDFDFNGDGYDDLAVGAPYYSPGTFFPGRVYIHYRGPGADGVADLVLNGAAVDENLGWSIDSGDVNGDGYDDLIVGALQCCSYKGLAYVYFGGATPNAVPDLTMTGAVNDDVFGWSVASGGDINNDGYDDWIVGAFQNDTGGLNAGRAYVFLGGATPNNVVDVTLTGAAALDYFGYSVSIPGDVNGDGYDDFLVGAYTHDTGGSAAGRAYLYYGGSSPNGTVDVTFDGSESSLVGQVVAGAGDWNGDGFADIVAGSYSDDTGGTNAGRLRIWFGGNQPDNVADLFLEGDTSDSLGYSVASGGDLDGDGYDDLIVGVPGGGSAGEVQVFRGGPSSDGIADLVISGEEAYDKMGWCVAAGGDLNADGRRDLVAATRLDDDEVHVYSLSGYHLQSPNGGEQWVAGRPATIRWLGREMTDIGISTNGGATWTTVIEDVGGGTENAFTLTAPSPATDQAMIRIRIAGTSLSPSTSDVSDAPFRIVEAHDPPAAVHAMAAAFNGAALGDAFGISVTGAGDVNGDGYPDLLAGATGNDAGGASAGRAYIYFGGPSLDTTPDVTFTGLTSSDALGAAVDAAGDVNGDGFDDVIVTAPGNDVSFTNAGAAYVYFGGVAMDNTSDWTLLGLAASDGFGNDASGAGDINGDGYADVIVGAQSNDIIGSSSGAAYVYFGGPAPDALPDLTLPGASSSDLFGSSVAGGQDVNGDGHPDLLVGASNADVSTISPGRVYLYFGGPLANATADLVLTGEGASDNFGIKVTFAGDIDGDGHADMLVGSNGNDAGGTSAGRAYLFHGGPSADDTPDAVWTGLAGETLGQAIGAAGDVNGDGFDDLLLGAPANDFPATDAGRMLLVYGGPGADTVPDLELRGGLANWQLGGALAGVGDVTGDGIGDFVVGARQPSSSGPGLVRLHDGQRFLLTAPSGGDTWNVGATETVAWSGAEPADLWLSVDGGNSYTRLADDVGGLAENTRTLLVPHQPTRFARLKLTPHDPAVNGSTESDSLFTIDASIVLLDLKAQPIDGGGIALSWNTDPGPADLAGYRIERSPGDGHWSVAAALVRETSWVDRTGAPGTRYRLFGVNGLGQDLLLGETGLGPIAALSAWPLPFAGGSLHITFRTGGKAGGAAPAEVSIFDVSGRRIRTILSGEFEPGSRSVDWDGRDDAGESVPGGIYFLRAASGGTDTRLKIPVTR
jgi:hypothetical protein